MNEALRNFDLGGNDVELDGYIELIEAMSADLREDQVTRLWGILVEVGGGPVVEYGADFDMKEEVQAQLVAVRAMRDHVMPGGRIRPGLPTREVKEVVTASSTLLTTLLKTHDKILSFDRQRAIEQAVTEAVMTLPDERKEEFFSLLAENLSVIT